MERDPISDFGPGRPGGGGLDREMPDDEPGREGEAGSVSPVTGSTDPETASSYDEEIEAERTGGTAGAATGSGDTRDDVLTDALDDERNPDPTERR